MKVIAIIQARMSSERLPGKVIKPLNGIPMIVQICKRVNNAKLIDGVVVATSSDSSDDRLVEICHKNNIKTFRGSLNNVLERYYFCATSEKAEVVVRLTGDNALVDSCLIDKSIELFSSSNLDYLSYCKELPVGMSTEVFTYNALEKTYDEASDSECKEHVTPYMYTNGNKFKWTRFSDARLSDNSSLRLTVDTVEDWNLIKYIYEHFGNKSFDYPDVLRLFNEQPSLSNINSMVVQKKLNYHGEQNQNDTR